MAIYMEYSKESAENLLEAGELSELADKRLIYKSQC